MNMKPYKTIVASILALGIAGSAFAATTVRITGSTAFRNATEDSLTALLKPGFTWGGVGGGIGKTQLIMVGNLVSNNDAVVIVTAFTGSEGGIYNLTHPLTPPANATYINLAAFPGLAAQLTVYPAAAFNVPAGDATDNSAADIAMADTFQSSSAYTTPSLNSPAAVAGAPASTVGIVPFTWVGNVNNDPGITNMTHQLAKACLGGVATYALFNPAAARPGVGDDSIDVFGRDPDSGTRDTTFLESAYGNFTPPVQYATVGPTGSLTGVELYPAETINGNPIPAGQGGYASGGGVDTAMADHSLGLITDAVGYIGTGDSFADLEANNLVPMSWEGVTFAVAGQASYAATFLESAITSGQYTFWGYEHIYVSGTIGADATSVASGIVTQLTTTANIVNEHSGFLLTDIVNAHVARATDGSPVFFTN
jgi:hypothetical protein